MNILIGNHSFIQLTGAELYAYTLAKHLVKKGHRVIVSAEHTGGIVEEKAKECGIEVYNMKQVIPDFEPDILHLCEFMPATILLGRYSNKIPAVATIHSEFISEKPLRSDRIKKYICIRESILEKVVKDDLIPREKTIHIPNGFDTDRFNTDYTPPNNEKKIILYIGTIDFLRKDSVLHLIDLCEQAGMVAHFIGLKRSSYDYLEGYPHWIKPDGKIGGIWNIEDYVKKCDMTAGILLGRTTIEGWLCGKPGIIYDIDRQGKILSVKYYPPPKDVVEKYGVEGIAKKIVAVYEEAMKK